MARLSVDSPRGVYADLLRTDRACGVHGSLAGRAQVLHHQVICLLSLIPPEQC